MPLKKWCVGFNLKYNIQTTYENLIYFGINKGKFYWRGIVPVLFKQTQMKKM